MPAAKIKYFVSGNASKNSYFVVAGICSVLMVSCIRLKYPSPTIGAKNMSEYVSEDRCVNSAILSNIFSIYGATCRYKWRLGLEQIPKKLPNYPIDNVTIQKIQIPSINPLSVVCYDANGYMYQMNWNDIQEEWILHKVVSFYDD